MRYLKRFNEALERDYEGDFTQATLDEIKDYCEFNLAYLLDLGMTINCSDLIDDRTNQHECLVELSFDGIAASTILDQVIPFFKRIKNDYELGTFYNQDLDMRFRFNTGDGQYHVSYDELDKVEDMIMNKPSVQRNIDAGFDVEIYNIDFYINDEK